MSRLSAVHFIGGVLLVFSCVATLCLNAQSAPAWQGKDTRPLPPRSATGFFGNLGVCLTVEGVLDDGSGKVEHNTLVVDTVNGKRLVKPQHLLVKNVRLPANMRCVLRGYELGEMIGIPPAEFTLAKELGRDAEEMRRGAAVGWHWRPYFVPLVAVHPNGLNVAKNRGQNISIQPEPPKARF